MKPLLLAVAALLGVLVVSLEVAAALNGTKRIPEKLLKALYWSFAIVAFSVLFAGCGAVRSEADIVMGRGVFAYGAVGRSEFCGASLRHFPQWGREESEPNRFRLAPC